MKRIKKHRIKQEMPESSQMRKEEHDLAYFIHDRVELMHQVFSVLKQKEIKAMAPQCVQHISLDDLQELCTEELLGISSKRLCAILDGADPPSNTDSSSSSPERLEVISLDSISSDDEILSQDSSKKSKKHRHRHSKKKQKKKESPRCEEENNKASRAGLTVLELLELQARARAIRAQLQQHQMTVPAEQSEGQDTQLSGDDDEVVIKEEAPEVVEISSEDEKPSANELEKQLQILQKTRETAMEETAKKITKRVNDLIITVPQTKTTRKIKLNRSKSTKNDESVSQMPEVVPPTDTIETVKIKDPKDKKNKRQQKKKFKRKQNDGSDHDEITLQLSDSEKMDLLEDYDRRASTEDSESSLSESSTSSVSGVKSSAIIKSAESSIVASKVDQNVLSVAESNDTNEEVSPTMDSFAEFTKSIEATNSSGCKETAETEGSNNIVESHSETIEPDKASNIGIKETTGIDKIECRDSEDNTNTTQELSINAEDGEIINKELSDGELSEESPEVKESTTAVVCISDDEKKSKKKKKKEKKSKKNKKSDFRENADLNFYSQSIPRTNSNKNEDRSSDNIHKESIDSTDATFVKSNLQKENSIDDVFEYLELSDDSSCYEVEGLSVSKEPTAEEIVALSAKIDEIETVDAVAEEEIQEHEHRNEIENISWKDRYLKSKKVTNVLNTANILNALRKKNKELKKKIEENKTEGQAVIPEKVLPEINEIEEGSIDHYNTLQGSTKFVDPVKHAEPVTKEMEKDAKQLLKMYKKLLKYNDMNKTKDPGKKKKKKQKKSKEKDNDLVIKANVHTDISGSPDISLSRSVAAGLSSAYLDIPFRSKSSSGKPHE
ncbi:unnamed protein product [Leptosia nina]|uniref:Uncharacterized protein n=1 Tax=Leptosia nina TaxID=320188 RepID=A0AAV1K1Q1_9NEOP